MENGDIPDEGIHASAGDDKANLARLNGSQTWNAKGSEVEPWIQADIQYQTYVSGVLTQGDGDTSGNTNWIKSFKVSTFLLDVNSVQTFVQDENGDDLVSHKPCSDGSLPSSVSRGPNLRGDYHNPLPTKLVYTRKNSLRRLVICWKTRR